MRCNTPTSATILNATMPSTMPSQNKSNSVNFTAAYLRVLTSQQPAREDWEAAAELIDAGFAKGKAHRESTTGKGAIDALIGFSITVQGRVYAQQLQEETRKRTLGYRVKMAVYGVATYVLGILTPMLQDLLKEAAKAFLGA